MNTTIDEQFAEWKRRGEDLLGSIDAEHDVIFARIERDRLYLEELKVKRRELARRLDLAPDETERRVVPAELPPNGRPFKVHKMSRAEQRAVPVEVISPRGPRHVETTPAAKISETMFPDEATALMDNPRPFLTARDALVLVLEDSGEELTSRELVARASKLGSWKESTLKVEVSHAAGDGTLTKREIEGQTAFLYGLPAKKAA